MVDTVHLCRAKLTAKSKIAGSPWVSNNSRGAKTMKRLLMWFVVLCISVTTQAADQCSDILQNGFINTESLNSNVGVMNDFNAWLCTTEFHTHQEARNAGIGLGV